MTGLDKLMTDGPDGILTFDVCPWSHAHPRNDAQAIFPLKNGRLLLAWSEYYIDRPSRITLPRYGGDTSDNTPCRLSAKVSSDAGRTWSETFTLLDSPVRNAKHPAFLRLLSGDILFLYTEWYNNRDRRVLARISKDDAETWSEPARVSVIDGFNVLNNDHLIQLKTGRIVIPSFVSPIVWKKPEEHFRAFCYFSDDDGKSWQASANRVDVPARGAEEPSIVERKDGSLLMYFRTSLGSIYRATSTDSGVTWSGPESTGICAPASPPLLKRIPSTGDLLLVWNDSHDPEHHHQGERTPLTAAISRDDGLTWAHQKNIEVVTGGAAAYASVYFQNDEVLIAYYYQEKTAGSAAQIRLKIIPLKWFYR